MRRMTITSRRDMTTGTVGAWIGVDVACSSSAFVRAIRVVKAEAIEGGQGRAFCLRADATVDRGVTASSAVRTPRATRCQWKCKERARDRLTGIRTRGSREPNGLAFYMGHRCVRFKAHGHCAMPGCFVLPSRVDAGAAGPGGTMVQLTACVWISFGTFSATGVGQAIC
jgi:hypothetical protein